MRFKNKRRIILAGIFLMTILSIYTMHRISESSVENRMLDIVGEAGSLPDKEIINWFEDYKETIRLSGEFFLYNDWRVEEIQQFFSDKIVAEGDFLRLYFSDGNHTNIMYPDHVLPEDFDPRVRDWFQQAIQSDEVIVTGIYTGATDGVKMITVATAVSDFSGNFLGVIAGDIPVERIQERLSRKLEDFNGGIAITGDGEDGFHAFESVEMEGLHKEIIAKAMIELIQEDTFDFFAVDALKTSRGYYLLSWAPVEDSPWWVVTYTPLGDSLAQSRGALWVLIEISLLILGIGIFIWVLFYGPYRWLIREIGRVNIRHSPEYRIIWGENWGFNELVDQINDFLSQYEKKHLYVSNSINHMETLAEENRVLDALYKEMPHGLVSLDKGGHIVDCNEAFSDLFGVDPDRIMALRLAAVIGSGESLPEEMSREKKMLEGVRNDARGNPLSLEIHVFPVVMGEELVKTYVFYRKKPEN